MARTPAGPCVAAQSADPALAGPGMGSHGALYRQRSAVARRMADCPGILPGAGLRTIAGARRALVFRAVQGLCGRRGAGLRIDHAGGIDALWPRSALHADGDVQSAAGHCLAAAGHAVVRPGPGQPGFRIDSFRAVGNGCEYVLGLPDGVGNPAHGGAQLRTDGLALCAGDPGAGRAAFDPVGPAHCLGLCLAHVDRRRAGVRRVQRQRRAGLVHLPESQRVIHRSRFRRPGRRGADRPGCGKPGVRHAGARDGAPLGHAAPNAAGGRPVAGAAALCRGVYAFTSGPGPWPRPRHRPGRHGGSARAGGAGFPRARRPCGGRCCRTAAVSGRRS